MFEPFTSIWANIWSVSYNCSHKISQASKEKPKRVVFILEVFHVILRISPHLARTAHSFHDCLCFFENPIYSFLLCSVKIIFFHSQEKHIQWDNIWWNVAQSTKARIRWKGINLMKWWLINSEMEELAEVSRRFSWFCKTGCKELLWDRIGGFRGAFE